MQARRTRTASATPDKLLAHLLPAPARRAHRRVHPERRPELGSADRPPRGLASSSTTRARRSSRRLTGDNIGRKMAIILDEKINSAPVIESRIGGGAAASRWAASATRSQLQQEAKDLVARAAHRRAAGAAAEDLRDAGRPDAGPRRGRQGQVLDDASARSPSSSSCSSTTGCPASSPTSRWCSTSSTMLAILAALEATLTLPGIAGVVLTVGMAVDANIIIYERIREELRAGKSRARRRRGRLRPRLLDGLRRARHQPRRRHRALLVRHRARSAASPSR